MDTALFQALLDFIGQHPLLTGLIIFLVAFAESLAIVGLFMPGAVLMFAFGMLIGGGQIDFFDAFAWAVVGAVAGDGLSFWLGRHYHQQLKVMWPFRRYPKLIAKGSDFFAKHGSKSILFGRFVGPVRPIIPAIAGMMEMPSLRFFFVNLLSALLWAPAYLLPGMAFGASLNLAAEVAGRLVVILLVVLVLLVITVWVVRHLVYYLQPRTNPLIHFALRRTHRIPYLGNITEAMLDHDHPETRVLGSLFLLLLFASTAIALLFVQVVDSEGVGSLNLALHNLLQGLRTEWADALMAWFTRLGSLYFLIPFSLLLGASLLFVRDRATPIYLLILLLAAQLSVLLLKNTTLIERPDALYQGLHQYAFPSSHALMSTVIFLFLAVVFAARLPLAWRWLPYTFASVLVVMVAFSRLYLGAHWLSDVTGGILLGLLWVSLAGIAYRRHHLCPMRARPLFGLSLLFLLITSLGYTLFAPDAQRLARPVAAPTVTLSLQQWQQQGWRELPALRQDLRGYNNHPFNLQWAAGADELSGQLQKAGWQPATRLSLTNALRYLAPTAALDELPVPNHIHGSRAQTLLFSRVDSDSTLLVIRLWPSRYQLKSGQPVWFGNASFMRIEGGWGWLKLLRTGQEFDAALEALQGRLAAGLCQGRRRDDGAALLLCH